MRRTKERRAARCEHNEAIEELWSTVLHGEVTKFRIGKESFYPYEKLKFGKVISLDYISKEFVR